ncbi:MAG: hypothetical protein O2931_05220 [Planctomycetota bacterium]|nr:hypothetical protein [Planctomycetota bacterium]MDA1178183.1 hypothetical protein [Planctomycetota bacterium]
MRQQVWTSLDSATSVAQSRPSAEPHPFYVFTTIWLALFLLGIACWPTVPPRFQSESAISLQITNASLTMGDMSDRLAKVARKLVVGPSSPRIAGPIALPEPNLTWRIDERPAESRMVWHLMLAGRAPVATTKKLSILSHAAMQLLDEELLCDSISVFPSHPDHSTVQVPAWVAWLSNPVQTHVMPGRSVTTSQVILLAALACLAAGWFTAWSSAHAAVAPVTEPTEMAKRLDLPVLGILDVGYSQRQPRAIESTGYPWHRLWLRAGEVCVALACSVALFQSVRSREMRELFISDPLTLFRSVVRPISTASTGRPDSFTDVVFKVAAPPSTIYSTNTTQSTADSSQCIASLNRRVPEGN